MDALRAVARALRRSLDFSGRADRAEFWWFLLVWVLVYLGGAGLSRAVGSLVPVLLADVLLVPAVAVAVRRLHDTGRSGAFVLLGFIPLAGPVVVLVLCARRGDESANLFGPPLSRQEGPVQHLSYRWSEQLGQWRPIWSTSIPTRSS